MLILFWVSLFLASVNGAKIVGYFPFPSKSQFTQGTILLKELANRGHEVTMISQHPLKVPIKNYRDIILEKTRPFYETAQSSNLFNWGNENVLSNLYKVVTTSPQFTDLTLADKNLQKFLSLNETFDVLILSFGLNDAHLGLGHKFNAHVIVLSAMGRNHYVDKYVGNPYSLAMNSHPILGFPDKMSVKERLINCIAYFVDELLQFFYIIPKQQAILKKHFPDAPSLNTLMKNVSLVLMNSHISYSYARPMVSNMIEIGGFHISKERDVLTDDIQTFLDQSRKGVIYFSLGSVIQSKNLPATKRDAFLKAFSQLEENVLWKWEDDAPLNKSDNVKVGTWLPQLEILAHPNVKMFISHGGILSTIESLYYGVPVIGIPIFGDQKANMKALFHRDLAVSLDFNNITSESVLWAVNEIRNNNKYKNNVKERSEILRKQDLQPLDRAIFWIEHIIHHKGAYHLRSSSNSLTFIEMYLIDIVGVILILFIFISYISYKIVKSVCRLRQRKPIQDEIKKIQ